MTTNEQVNAAKNDFALHLGLVIRQEGVNKSRANIIAWLEGPSGLETRIHGGRPPVAKPPPPPLKS